MSTGNRNTSFLDAHAYGLAALMNLREVPTIQDGYKFRLFQSVNIQMVGHAPYVKNDEVADNNQLRSS